MNKSGRHYIWCVEAHVYLFLPRHYEYPGYRSKLVQLYSNSSFYAWILRKSCGISSCWYLWLQSYVMLCCAGVLTACFACGNSTIPKHLKIELWCVCVCVWVCARACMVCLCVCLRVHVRAVSLYGTKNWYRTHTRTRTHTHTRQSSPFKCLGSVEFPHAKHTVKTPA